MDGEKVTYFIAISIIVLAVVISLGIVSYIERRRFDLCMDAVSSASYCTVEHPWGAHDR